ncbi:fructosamine kinase family protein [Nocardia sp. NPDC087230]|uniref:fructosamine kinase family protein n=1 Tax=Nocardia sp. NPDC087230 TaxID=3364331 RepID=UPI00380D22A8
MLDNAHLSELLNSSIDTVVDLGARHSWTLHRATTGNGQQVFVKATADCGPVLAAEAAGLRWLATDTESSPVAEVLAVDDTMLVLPWLTPQEGTVEAARRFGHDLATVHSRPAPTFGADWDGYIADLALDNTPSTQPWNTWYAEARLLPYLRTGHQHLEPDETRLIETVIARIDSLAGPTEPPSRIHGDLWSGNVVWSGGRGVLIDPAAHAGHRETDLAMLALFGIDHLDDILDSYTEATRLADGWRERIPLHQLHPLLVHLVLFGARYRSAVVEAATAALRIG